MCVRAQTAVEALFACTTTIADRAPAMPATVAELAESTVQILLLAGEQPVCSGSGTIIDDRGTILTNAHVIEPGNGCDYDRIGIAITADAGVPPELLYVADVYAYDPVVDLAVVRIATDLDGTTASGPFNAVPVGDSDAVAIGDQLRILGYPGIGGDTVTFTNGVVSGFASQNGIGERSWIKTDATIAGGNSGGAAFDDDGNLVGVPTQASASDTGEVVDCRVITDTNGDGNVDGLDQCVPIGGFLNGLRPVNLAQPLIDQADTGAPISIQESVAVGEVDLSELYIFNPGWSLMAPDDPEFSDEFVLTATAGAENLCLWFDWEGLPNGVLWDGIWQVDGVVEEGFSFFNEEWSADETGFDYWLCAVDPTGLASGLYACSFYVHGDVALSEPCVLTATPRTPPALPLLPTTPPPVRQPLYFHHPTARASVHYEFIFYVESDVAFYESFEITDTPRPLHDLTFVNNTGAPVCYLFVAPFGAVDSGLDELARTELLEAGASRTVTVPEGTVIADAYDCEFDPVYVNYDGLAVSGPTTIDLTG